MYCTITTKSDQIVEFMVPNTGGYVCTASRNAYGYIENWKQICQRGYRGATVFMHNPTKENFAELCKKWVGKRNVKSVEV